MSLAHEAPDAERIARALGSAKPTGGGWSCRCPAHEDKHASLSLGVKDGRLLWRCHAGCDQRSVQDALANKGLIGKPTGAVNGTHRPPLRVVTPPAQAIGRIVATYDYVDVTGVFVFQVVRFDPKTFRQRRPKGSGWEWGLGKVDPVLYRLPDLATAETVFVPEGEKDVDRLRAIGLAATTSPMGAGKWRQHYGEYLTGKHVVVLPDNDESGRKHAEDVASSAYAHQAASVRVIALPKLKDKGDLSDWLDAGNTRSDLEALVRAAALWKDGTEAGDPAWRSRLVQGDKGPIGNEANVDMALRYAPELAGRLRFDAFRTAAQCRQMPWDARPEWRDWTDDDDVKLAVWVQRCDINFPSHRCVGVVEGVAHQLEHHPIRDYLSNLKWDGEQRVEHWLNVYLGASYPSDEPGRQKYLRAIGAKWLISAIARIYRPGCKADCALVIEGPQGIGKSSALAALMPSIEWFADEIADLGSKDGAQDVRGKWLIELGELSAVKRGDTERVKAFMSRGIDHYRPSYGRRSVDIPRQCVFAGTTNNDNYLRDETGNRRFWPVKAEIIDRKRLALDRDQLWAEALHLYRAGADWWLTRDEDRIAVVEQAARVQEDPWDDPVAQWLSRTTLTKVTVTDILRDVLSKEPKDWTQADQNRVARSLKMAGWKRARARVGGRLEWGYVRPQVE